MEKEVQAYLERSIRHATIVFSDGERKEFKRAYFDYKKRLIEVFQEGKNKPVGIIPLEAVKSVWYME